VEVKGSMPGRGHVAIWAWRRQCRRPDSQTREELEVVVGVSPAAVHLGGSAAQSMLLPSCLSGLLAAACCVWIVVEDDQQGVLNNF